MSKRASRKPASRDHFGSLIGKNKKMQELYSIIKAISPTTTTVLITGETGTGKELVARAIHEHSERRYKSFLKVDCTALPETLLESELFGYKKGAFTDARINKPGKFEMADKGTIFLDEIGEIPLPIQAKLLRVIEEHAFEPLGSTGTVKVDVRIITATNRNLLKAIERGQFRKDLYYRLNVFRIHMPELRERTDDIPLLVEAFIELYNRHFGKRIKDISDDAANFLMDYSWPGNVRQLRHAIEYAFVNCPEETIETEHLPVEIRHSEALAGDKVSREGKPIDEIEKEVILKSLERNRYNRKATAKELKISRTTLWRKMQKHNLA